MLFSEVTVSRIQINMECSLNQSNVFTGSKPVREGLFGGLRVCAAVQVKTMRPGDGKTFPKQGDQLVMSLGRERLLTLPAEDHMEPPVKQWVGIGTWSMGRGSIFGVHVVRLHGYHQTTRRRKLVTHEESSRIESSLLIRFGCFDGYSFFEVLDSWFVHGLF